MTKQKLSQLRSLRRELKTQRAVLRTLERTNVSGLEIAALRRLIGHNERRIQKEALRLEQYIATVEDSQMREILRARYLRGMSWQRVAFAIGETDESLVRKKHDRFLARAGEKA